MDNQEIRRVLDRAILDLARIGRLARENKTAEIMKEEIKVGRYLHDLRINIPSGKKREKKFVR